MWNEQNRQERECRIYMEEHPDVVDEYLKKHPGAIIKNMFNKQYNDLLEMHKKNANDNLLSLFISQSLA